MHIFSDHYQQAKGLFEEYLNEYFSSISDIDQDLKKSLAYSLMDGGKRFRPVLALFTAETFGVSPQKILPFAVAVEMIHTYSLIHDDLPCMDNDDFRRGKLTNHKVFGESMALLAGDGLLTEAFYVLAKHYTISAPVKVLSEAAGIIGMVDGQVRDIKAKDESASLEQLKTIHRKKTGALIAASTEGVGAICGLTSEVQSRLKSFGQSLGFAFQLKDDLLDSKNKIEAGSIPSAIGLQETKATLEKITAEGFAVLQQLEIEGGPLFGILQMNLERTE